MILRTNEPGLYIIKANISTTRSDYTRTGSYFYFYNLIYVETGAYTAERIKLDLTITATGNAGSNSGDKTAIYEWTDGSIELTDYSNSYDSTYLAYYNSNYYIRNSCGLYDFDTTDDDGMYIYSKALGFTGATSNTSSTTLSVTCTGTIYLLCQKPSTVKEISL